MTGGASTRSIAKRSGSIPDLVAFQEARKLQCWWSNRGGLYCGAWVRVWHISGMSRCPTWVRYAQQGCTSANHSNFHL